MYNEDKIDLTETVLTALNNQYKNGNTSDKKEETKKEETKKEDTPTKKEDSKK